MYDFTKSFEENQKLAREYTTSVTNVAVEFNKKLFEAATSAANTLRDQTVEFYKAVGVKFPGLN